MTAVTANQLINRGDSDRASYPVLASTTIYAGTLVFIDLTTGYASGDDEAGVNPFVGIAVEEVDNSSGSSGDLDVDVHSEGQFVLTGSGFAQTSVGLKVYAIDNYTLQLSSTSATLVGVITEYISATSVKVRIITDVDQ